jgi:hypothetical protein
VILKFDAVPGSKCRADHPVMIVDQDGMLSYSISDCRSSDTWKDAAGRTCSEYAQNALAVRNTFNCSFSGKTFTDEVGVLTDGMGPYIENARSADASCACVL